MKFLSVCSGIEAASQAWQPLAAQAHVPCIAQSFSNRGIAANVPETLRAASHGALPMVAQAMQVRRLMPSECSKLQGFDPAYLDAVRHKGRPLADGPKYKALGNSWAVPCVTWIGQRIQAVQEITEQQKAAA